MQIGKGEGGRKLIQRRISEVIFWIHGSKGCCLITPSLLSIKEKGGEGEKKMDTKVIFRFSDTIDSNYEHRPK